MPLAITSLDDFICGHSPRPVSCGHGLEIGAGTVIPEINFTLPAMEISEATWPEIRKIYESLIEDICKRSVDLEVPGVLVEFETLPAMTNRPRWGLEIVEILATALRHYHDKYGLKGALRFTPNDIRDYMAPSRMRSGPYFDAMITAFEGAAAAGADILSIESTGGKEVCDEAVRYGNLREMVFGLSILAARDMHFLWTRIVETCRRTGIVAGGDAACAFGNTAMVLADQRFIPKVFAALVRVATVPRSLVAYQVGATGPSKDCSYEGPYLKAMTGIPIAMEGRASACAHLTHVGNIVQAVCDTWSNESVQYVRLLSAYAPTVSMEHLAYDCRMMNVAGRTHAGAVQLRDWAVDSDAGLDPQAWVLRPDVALRISARIIEERTPYLQTRAAAFWAAQELSDAIHGGLVKVNDRESRWLDKLMKNIDQLPDDENELISEMLASPLASKFIPEEYGIKV
jgi:methanol--5-hydroxybenzimidazolylcobamide Co-methyltransferase